MALLQDKVAIITGGTGALGRAVADRFLSEGAKVAIPYIIDAEVPMLEQRLGGRFAQGNLLVSKVDVGNAGQFGKFVDDTVKKFGRVDALVNLVGGFWGGKPIPRPPSTNGRRCSTSTSSRRFCAVRRSCRSCRRTSTAGSFRSPRAAA